MTAKRGRPILAAQSLDAALEAEYSGTSPLRSRNEFERAAMRKTKGRKINLASPTQQAAGFAVHLINRDGLTKQAAAQQAADKFHVHSANVRNYVRAILKGPQVRLSQKKPSWFGSLPPITKSFLVSSAESLEIFGNHLIEEPNAQQSGQSGDSD